MKFIGCLKKNRYTVTKNYTVDSKYDQIRKEQILYENVYPFFRNNNKVQDLMVNINKNGKKRKPPIIIRSVNQNININIDPSLNKADQNQLERTIMNQNPQLERSDRLELLNNSRFKPSK